MEPDEADTSFHYLQYESTEISHGNTRWKVYGSPVCILLMVSILVSILS